MKIDNNNYSIAEIRDMLARKDLMVNRAYQRAANLWPLGPRSYFIDTILMDFPFPKLYFYEYLDKTVRKTKREIVDGQQRVTTIIDFLENKFRLTTVSRSHQGKVFSELPDDLQHKFLAYSLPVDVVRNAEKTEILEMFRRMNAYTLPLNEAEKRHSTFAGTFKWFINRLVDDLSSVFSEFGIFTNRQIIRMADTELLAEMIIALEQGIVPSTGLALNHIYSENNEAFPRMSEYDQKIQEMFTFITQHLGDMRGSYLMKPYVIHSLFTAMMHNKYELPGVTQKIGIGSIGSLCSDVADAKRGLEALSRAHESGDTTGALAEYVLGCGGGPGREPRRTARVKFLCMALNGQI